MQFQTPGPKRPIDHPMEGGFLMAQTATTALYELPYEEAVQTTLLELVETVGELTDDDREVVATVIQLLRSGRVRLTGNFRGQKLAEA